MIVKKIKLFFHDFFYLDLRSLAILRIGIAGLLLADIIDRAQYITELYTDVGFLPRSDWYALQPQFPWTFSLHIINGTYHIQLALFILAGIFAGMLLIGYRTTLATITSWILLLSLHNRNLLFISGPDVLLRLVLFWGMFLPWHARFSIDATLSRKISLPTQFVSAGTTGYIFQVIFLYVFAALLKSSPDWQTDGTAIYYALSLDIYRTYFGNIFYHIPSLLKPFTHAVFYMELFGTLFLFIPFKRGFFRFLAIFIFISFHIGTGLTMRLGIFPILGTVIWLAFLPSSFWNVILKFCKNIFFITPHFLQKTKKTISTISINYKRHTFNPKISYTSSTLSLLIIFFIIYVFFWNISTLPGHETFMPTQLKAVGRILKLNQKWNMFAPHPPHKVSWLFLPARLNNNIIIDLYTNRKSVSFEKPQNFSSLYERARLQKFLIERILQQNNTYSRFYANYLCRQWNTTHTKNQQIIELTIISISVDTLPEYKFSPLQKRTLYFTKCISNKDIH